MMIPPIFLGCLPNETVHLCSQLAIVDFLAEHTDIRYVDSTH